MYGLLICGWWLNSGTALAVDATPAVTTAPPATRGTALSTPKKEFRRGLRERDLSLGYSRKFNFRRFEGRTDVEFVTLTPRFGRFRNARQEILIELPITMFTRPDVEFGIGVNLFWRQYLTRRNKLTPYLEFGTGLFLTDFRVRELSGSLQFALQSGLGMRIAHRANSDFVVSARWYHLSNAGIRAPNAGLNNALVTVGYSQLF